MEEGPEEPGPETLPEVRLLARWRERDEPQPVFLLGLDRARPGAPRRRGLREEEAQAVCAGRPRGRPGMRPGGGDGPSPEFPLDTAAYKYLYYKEGGPNEKARRPSPGAHRGLAPEAAQEEGHEQTPRRQGDRGELHDAPQLGAAARRPEDGETPDRRRPPRPLRGAGAAGGGEKRRGRWKKRERMGRPPRRKGSSRSPLTSPRSTRSSGTGSPWSPPRGGEPPPR